MDNYLAPDYPRYIRLRSWKNDYLHRPSGDGDIKVTAWAAGLGSEWILIPLGRNSKTGKDEFLLKSWRGDYLYRVENGAGVTTTERGKSDGNIWTIDTLYTGTKLLVSNQNDWLHRPDSNNEPKIVTYNQSCLGNEWVIESADIVPEFPQVISMKSCKGDYLHRPVDNTVTAWVQGARTVGNAWNIIIVGLDNEGRYLIRLKSWQGDYLSRTDSSNGIALSREEGEKQNLWVLIKLDNDKYTLMSNQKDWLCRSDSDTEPKIMIGTHSCPGNEWTIEPGPIFLIGYKVPAGFSWNKVADHTYVRSTDGYSWNCWGSAEGGTAICYGQGSSAVANCISIHQPANPDFTKECAGIRHYAIDGVCHQAANRILYPAGVIVDQAAGYWLSVTMFGTYGVDHEEFSRRIRVCNECGCKDMKKGEKKVGSDTEISGDDGAKTKYLDNVNGLYMKNKSSNSLHQDNEAGIMEILEKEFELMATYRLGDVPACMAELHDAQKTMLTEKAKIDDEFVNQKISQDAHAEKVNEVITAFSRRCAIILGEELYVKLFDENAL